MCPFKESSKISKLTYSENDSFWWVSPGRDIRSLLGCWTYFSLDLGSEYSISICKHLLTCTIKICALFASYTSKKKNAVFFIPK